MAEFTEFAPLKYNPQEVAQRGFGMAASGPTDDRLIVGFFRKSILNQFRSRAEGVPIHEDHDFVKIQHPGETLNIVERPVRDDDKLRWPRQWAQFSQGINQIPDGIPISLLFPDKPSIAATLRGYNIHTVEQLANLSAQGMLTVGMGCQDWVNGAKRYLDHAEKGISHHKFETEMQAIKSENLKLQRQVTELTALVHQRTKPAPDAQTYDFQLEQLNASHQSEDMPITPPPAQFMQDLSTETTPRRGRPPGSKNKEKH
jgi:hypothetical protein